MKPYSTHTYIHTCIQLQLCYLVVMLCQGRLGTLLLAFLIGRFEIDGVAENIIFAGRLLPKTELLVPNMFDEFPSNMF